MTRSIFWLLMVTVMAAMLWCGCDTGQNSPPPQQVAPAPVPVAVPQPVAQPVQPAATPAPPPTPLIPVADTTPTGTKKTGSAGGVDKPLPGKATSGEEHIGMYTCSLSTGLPINPPGVGCRIFKGNDGTLKFGSSSSGMTSITGRITKSTPRGFMFVGEYKFPGNAVKLKTRMVRKAGASVYTGKGRGRLNNSASNQIKYTLTMKKR